MKKTVLRALLTTVVAGMSLPMAVHAADVDLQQKIDKLSKEVADLKGSVKKVEDKSLGKWLDIGGEYRFRVDSLHGQTAAYTDVMATFANAQNVLQSNFFNRAAVQNPADGSIIFAAGTQGASDFWQSQLGGMMTFQQSMNNVKTYDQANAFLGANAPMIGGLMNFAVQVPAYKPKNETLYTNKFGLDLTAKPIRDITVHAKLDMYKVFGSQEASPALGNYFSDRVGVFDGTLSHVPSDGLLNVDRAYATWSNIAEQPVWLSVGRRPATNGAPSNLRLNKERPGNGGTPALLVDYAFDGMTVGYAPDIDALPGAYAKVCYGRGFDSGIKTSSNSIKDTDMLGVAIIPYETDPLRVWFQWNRGFNIFDAPVMSNSAFGSTKPSTNLGDIDWYGIGAMSTLKNVGPGKLQLFSDFGLSVTHPNDNVSSQFGFMGLGTGAFFQPEKPSDKTGWAVYAGVRYDLPSKTKIGFEFNHGSKDWITFAPAADDMWTSKVGVRGNVYEPYIIQELNLKPISSYFAKAFFKLGYQYYDFEYTGSNNWVGAPQKISDIKSSDMMLLAPLKEAHNIYGTFEVHF
ncbi:MAG: DUF3373 family protein [Geobacter sp.]|nr:DUF3373 family protein [Geobacter sp.]